MYAYIKIGKIVHFSIHISAINSSGTPTSRLRIENLPFTATNVSFRGWFAGITFLNGTDYTQSQKSDLRGVVAPGTNYIDFVGISGILFAAPSISGGAIELSGFYETDS